MVNGFQRLAAMWGKKGSKPRLIDHIINIAKRKKESKKETQKRNTIKIPTRDGTDKYVEMLN